MKIQNKYCLYYNNKTIINLINSNACFQFSSSSYMNRHANDSFVKASRRENYRCRSAFKLTEINDKYRLVRSNQNILDIGAAPGGWSQVLLNLSKSKSNIVAVDLLKINNLTGVAFIQGDITDKDVIFSVNQKVDFSLFDLIVSDACPEFKGIKETDIANSNILNKKILNSSKKLLKLEGNLVFKVFENPRLNVILADAQSVFNKVHKFKPISSRSESSEFYFICLGYNAGLRTDNI